MQIADSIPLAPSLNHGADEPEPEGWRQHRRAVLYGAVPQAAVDQRGIRVRLYPCYIWVGTNAYGLS